MSSLKENERKKESSDAREETSEKGSSICIGLTSSETAEKKSSAARTEISGATAVNKSSVARDEVSSKIVANKISTAREEALSATVANESSAVRREAAIATEDRKNVTAREKATGQRVEKKSGALQGEDTSATEHEGKEKLNSVRDSRGQSASSGRGSLLVNEEKMTAVIQWITRQRDSERIDEVLAKSIREQPTNWKLVADLMQGRREDDATESGKYIYNIFKVEEEDRNREYQLLVIIWKKKKR